MKRFFPALECAIVFVVGCLAFVFFSPSVTRRVIVSPLLKFNKSYCDRELMIGYKFDQKLSELFLAGVSE